MGKARSAPGRRLRRGESRGTASVLGPSGWILMTTRPQSPPGGSTARRARSRTGVTGPPRRAHNNQKCTHAQSATRTRQVERQAQCAAARRPLYR